MRFFPLVLVACATMETGAISPCELGLDHAAAIEGQSDADAVDPRSYPVITSCTTFGDPHTDADVEYMDCFEHIIQWDGAWCVG